MIENFKSMKENQMPHTRSRRGMARLTEDLMRKIFNLLTMVIIFI